MPSKKASFFHASVILPSSGRPQSLEATLDALCKQEPGEESFEVIVADDGATPPLDTRLNPYRERLHLQSVRLEGRGPSAARNAAAQRATAPLLLFLDDDCVPGPGWVRSYLRAYAADPDAALSGPLANGTAGGLGAEAYSLIFTYLYTRHLRQDSASDGSTHAPFMLSANFGVAAQHFHSIGGFDERFRIAAEDREFSERWVRSGRNMLAVADAVVRHDRRLGVLQFLGQHFRFGRGRTMLQRAMQQRGWTQHRMESPSFYFRLVTFPLNTFCESNRLALILLILLSQVWTGAGALFEHGSILMRKAIRRRNAEDRSAKAKR